MEYRIKMTHAAVSAANHCLSLTETKGKSELKNHSRVRRALQKDVMEEKETRNPDGGEPIKTTHTKEGEMILDEDRFKYLNDSVTARVRQSIPGHLTVGYDDLIDAIEAAEKAAAAKPEAEKSDAK